MKYLGLVGQKSVGKDTAYDALKAYYGTAVARLSFADELKREVCELLGMDIDKLEANKNLPPVRKLLQEYGVWRRSQTANYWLLRADQVAFPPAVKLVVVTDCRFLNEAAWILNMGGSLVRITRPSLLADDTHITETEQTGISVDYTIFNDQTKLRLEKQIVDYVKNYAKLI